MASLNNVPRELLDSIRDSVDRRIKLSIKRLVNIETKRDKLEQRVLAFSPYRLFVFTAKAPTKIETNFHYLDIKSIESKKPNHLVISTAKASYTFFTLEADTDEVNHMITHIGTSLKTIFHAFPLERLIKTIDVQPPDRLRVMYDMMKSIDQKETGPCGGFTAMYACMCDFHNLTYRDEVAWDVDTIYLSQDSRELCLRDFDHLKERDLVPIVSALVHNTWFTTLNANNVKLAPEVCNEILRVMRKNSVIESLLMSNTGITSDFVKKLSTVCMSEFQLLRLDLSNNAIDDTGAEHIFGALSSRGKMFTYIDLSRTKVTSRGLNRVSENMSKSPHVFSSLQTLKLAGLASQKVEDLQNMSKSLQNMKLAGLASQKVEDLQSLYSFLAAPNMLSHLDMSGTDVELEKIVAPLQRGCSQNITFLKLSKTVFTHKRVREVVVPASFKKFFSTVVTLKHLDLSGAKVPPDALKELLLGIGANRNIMGMHLDISGIDMQGSQGAAMLANCLSNIPNISSLNISGIVFGDQDLSSVLNSIGQNKAIRHLYMGRIFQNIKPKNMKIVMDQLVHVIQDEDSAIETLSLSDSKLKDSMNMIINALGSNSSLTDLDISGNMMGDLGARMLSKALQINNKLKTIIWDKNNTSCVGFEDIADALVKNYTLRKMPIPVNDASAALRSQSDRTEQALQTIESLLQRNHSPQKYSSDQAYRLQQGFLISSTQQMVDRLVVQSQDTIHALTIDDGDSYTNDVELARSVIKDADNSKTLLPSLHDIAIQSQNTGNPVGSKLKEIAAELKTVLEAQMKETVAEMIEKTERQCNTLMKDEEFVSDLKSGCTHKSAFPKDFTTNILTGVDTEIFNTLSEMNLAVAAHVSDRVIDEVIERLSSSHKTLTNHLNQKKKDMMRRSQNLPQRTDSNNKADSPKQNKRKSMQARKIRPQSVIDGLENDQDVPKSPQVKTQTKTEPEIESFDVVPELKDIRPLTTVTKDRPRRAKQVRPTTRQSQLPGTPTRTEDGVESFFNTSNTVTTPSGPSKGDKSSKPSSNKVDKSTPETKKKLLSHKDSDKDKKKSGGVFGFLGKSPKNSPSPVAGKKGKRIVSDIQEDSEEPSSSQKSVPENTSLHGSVDRKRDDVSNHSSDSNNSSRKDSDKEDSESIKSTKSSDSGRSLDKSLDKKSDDRHGVPEKKKPLEVPRKKKPALREQKAEDEAKPSTEDLKEDHAAEEKEEEGEKKEEKEKEDEAVKCDKETDAEEPEKDADSSPDINDSEESESEEDAPSPAPAPAPAPTPAPTPAPAKPADKDVAEAPVVEEAPAPPKRPGVPGGLGFGINIMAEMKAKQEKRQSVLIVPTKTPEKPKQPEENQSPFGMKILKPVAAKTGSPKPEAQSRSPALTQKPADNISSEVGKSSAVTKDSSPSTVKKQTAEAEAKRSSLHENGVSPQPVRPLRPVLNKPPPPARPRPPPASNKPTPAPRRSIADGDQEEPEVDRKSASSEDSKSSNSEIVYDSATLKMSVKDKISKFGRTSGGSSKVERPRSKAEFEETEAEKKRNSLPKDVRKSDIEKPVSSRTSIKCDEFEAFLDHKTEENPEMIDSGIVQDAEKPTTRSKAGSLPRTAKPSDIEKDTSVDTPKRPKSMMAVLGNHPSLMHGSKQGAKSEAIPESEDASKKDSKKDDKPSTAEDVILV